jgi:hypothetical protein
MAMLMMSNAPRYVLPGDGRRIRAALEKCAGLLAGAAVVWLALAAATAW